ncbi:hypothetical protein SAMN06295912_1144 [Sphingomonas laterariae]|uniref:Uncharacterized protein n=1 Tax=Edaphosphingomonas laterariae TaxID=861865 RepID=A0A239GW97_9SPHN|nr:hypothetical protein [Sphingomonas laterariae]SNS73058.1 hypothetical protein SAMN06295912_1144 [Sphingomonas laterariae]
MMFTRQFKALRLLSVAALPIALLAAAPAQAEVRQVDGHLWTKSTAEQKQAYLVGVSNVLAVNHALQVKKGTADDQAPLSQYLRAVDAESMATIQQRLDSWYASNPSRLDTPVLGVFWMGVVKAGR